MKLRICFSVIEPKLNSFVTLTPELALDAAKKAETAIMRSENIGLQQDVLSENSIRRGFAS